MEYDVSQNKIEGEINDTDLSWLFDTAKEMESIVEIGSWKGRSTHALLSGCKGTVYSVDQFLDSATGAEAQAEAKKKNTSKDFTKNVGGFKNLQVLKMDSATAVRQFEDNSVDMVFINAGHAHDEVLADIKMWLPKARKIICGHDRPYWQVKKAVNESFGEEGPDTWERNEGRRGKMWIKKLQKEEVKKEEIKPQEIKPEEKKTAKQLSKPTPLKNIPDLSILIPAKNEEFLARTIEDILSHIEGNTEIIVVLDGYEIALPVLPADERVRVIINETSLGQRGATNQACKLSKAKYILKVDAHCAFDQGFDVKMMNEMQDNWTMVPVMRNLHAFNWVCPEGHIRYQGPSGPCKEEGCGKPTVKDVVWIPKTNPQSVAYCFDQEPHFQYFNEFKKRPEGKGDITESMSIQGSCFMLTRDKYWELNICDEAFGSWGSQGIEVACKTWLSGGRVVINHKTWYAHMFRTQGGDFGFPYHNPGRKVENAKKTARELFFDNKWELQTLPLSWLIERFWPIPGWTEEMRQKIKGWPLQNGKNVQGPSDFQTPKSRRESKELPPPESEPIVSSIIDAQKEDDLGSISPVLPTPAALPFTPPVPTIASATPTKGIIYYTDNLMDEKIMKVCQKQLSKASREAGINKIISVSLKPIDFGQNIVLPLERGYLTMFKQILAGLEALDTDIVFFCEHDVLYHPSHFRFNPTDRNVWYYNGNYWFLRHSDGFALHYNASPLSGLCVYRDIAIKHYKERIKMVEEIGFSYHIGFEPMTHGRVKWNDFYKFEVYQSEAPNVDIKHGKNLTRARWTQDLFRRKPTDWKEANIDTIPGWDNVRKLLR